MNEVPWIWTGPVTLFGPNNLDPQPSKVFFTIGNTWLNLWPAHNRHLITGELFEAIKRKNELEMLQYSTLWPWASVVKVPSTHSIPFPIIWTTLHWTILISWVVTFERWTITFTWTYGLTVKTIFIFYHSEPATSASCEKSCVFRFIHF